MEQELAELVASRRGHFRFESGHHGDLWLDLELLCLRPERVQRVAAELASRLAAWNVDVVCGALNEGAFVALMVAAQLNVEFAYSERFEAGDSDRLFPVDYRVPSPLRSRVRGRRVALVNDVINAGSAIRATYADLARIDAQPVVLATMVTLGSAAAEFADDHDLPFLSLVQWPNNLWLPDECPLCADEIPLTDGADHV